MLCFLHFVQVISFFLISPKLLLKYYVVQNEYLEFLSHIRIE
uniref:Uncharacterized protein n=1 Tax=Anguilla anguilla TaxID=7936 RepID=A0A0E9RQK8_ANGAN